MERKVRGKYQVRCIDGYIKIKDGSLAYCKLPDMPNNRSHFTNGFRVFWVTVD